MSNSKSNVPVVPMPSHRKVSALETEGAPVAWERFCLIYPHRAERIARGGFFIRDDDAPDLLAFEPNLLVLVRWTGDMDGREVVPLRTLSDIEELLSANDQYIRDVSLRVVR